MVYVYIFGFGSVFKFVYHVTYDAPGMAAGEESERNEHNELN